MSDTTNRSNQLEEIERHQREQEAQQQPDESNVFSKPIIESLQPRDGKPVPPLLTQEELDEDQPRVNWTAVICTAIVALTAAIILLVARPWQKEEVAQQPAADQQTEAVDKEAADRTAEQARQAQEQARQAEEQARMAEEQRKAEAAEAERKAAEAARKAAEEEARKNAPVTVVKDETAKLDEAKRVKSTLPVESVTTTGTQNSYNGVRLVNISKRQLSRDEVAQMSRREMSLARNAVYARHGYQFKNAELKEFFEAQRWFKGKTADINTITLSETEVYNINLIKELENKGQ